MKHKYTLAELLKFNHGSIEDTNSVIEFYRGKGLSEFNNTKEHIFLSDLSPKEFRMKSKFEKILVHLKETDTMSGILIKFGGWILLLINQYSNLMELIQYLV